jgi:hypothetical protein
MAFARAASVAAATARAVNAGMRPSLLSSPLPTATRQLTHLTMGFEEIKRRYVLNLLLFMDAVRRAMCALGNDRLSHLSRPTPES